MLTLICEVSYVNPFAPVCVLEYVDNIIACIRSTCIRSTNETVIHDIIVKPKLQNYRICHVYIIGINSCSVEQSLNYDIVILVWYYNAEDAAHIQYSMSDNTL